ncbi:MAG TPA: UxaA family hydrolase, partial [Aggregatilineales bacterium]|nr:UxaA family hydrolase [Aggregatilineales bacterium]
YVCNAAMLRELSRRTLNISVPSIPDFVDEVPDFVFDESSFIPGEAVQRYDREITFMGYPRSGNRGTGTRNFIILLGTTSLTAGFVTALEARLQNAMKAYPNIDGIVAVAHTEGGHHHPNNRELLLRTLAGFMVNPNVGAVLAVDYGHEALTIAALKDYMTAHHYPLDEVLHHFQTISGSFQDNLESASRTVEGWLDAVNASQRVPTSISHLKIALQCGGSDAFSGVSGNPLAAWVAKEIIAYGGSANLAETDELVGAERYMLKNVRDIETARRFVATLDRFKTWAGWHGHAVTGNPSGGNLLRGLYNIYLKSLGAAAKRNPGSRLDYVINYGDPMPEPGYYFMDSPGNDLESIAGQVASGCNMIFFVTGNGSITNFPFVPTIKIMTTTR